MKKSVIKISNIIATILLIIFLVLAWKVYQKNNFYDFVKAEYIPGYSTFIRDEDVKYNNHSSYRIVNEEFNDAMFYKKINVVPNTVYRVKCKIKTQDVIKKDEYSDVGAHISIGNTFEKSDNLVGTTDWQEVSFCFNSKNREQVDLGFRLGGAEGEVKGTAWFSDFTIESGVADVSNEWNFICLLFDYVDTNIQGQDLQLRLTATDKEDINSSLRRFKSSMEEMSLKKIRVSYDIVEISTPITHFSYDKDSGYYVSGYDVSEVLDPIIKQGKYDHIFIAFRSGDVNAQYSATTDWIGLGSMEYRGIGFSNIRLPEDDKSYIYKFDSRINIFPEEVFVHEFLHTLERNAEEYEYERPQLHDNSEYGYENEKLKGLKDWYQDYMNKEINANGKKVGLPPEIYTKKPAKYTNFEYSYKMDTFNEPENFMEEVSFIVKKLRKTIEILVNSEEVE